MPDERFCAPTLPMTANCEIRCGNLMTVLVEAAARDSRSQCWVNKARGARRTPVGSRPLVPCRGRRPCLQRPMHPTEEPADRQGDTHGRVWLVLDDFARSLFK